MTVTVLLECKTAVDVSFPTTSRSPSLIRCAGLRNVQPDFNVGNSILVFELDQKRLRALLDGPTPVEVGTGDMPYLKTNVEMP